jgi:hypothetical protein
MNLPRNRNVIVRSDLLTEGMFGQLTLWVFEILPVLRKAGLCPRWEIRSKNYGVPPDDIAIPGCWDPACETGRRPELAQAQVVSFEDFHRKYARVLTGNDWDWNKALWSSFFKAAQSAMLTVDALPLPGHRLLALHYRGTDKNADLEQTNPITREEFLAVADEFLETHKDIDGVFVASDEPLFISQARAAFGSKHRVICREQEALPFWRGDHGAAVNRAKADSALADCLILSRCHYLLKCQSALSGFAKVLNPGLQAYRVAASKLFAEIPYFPDAYLPAYRAVSSECQAILHRTMSGDWRTNRLAVLLYEGGKRRTLPRAHARLRKLFRRLLGFFGSK